MKQNEILDWKGRLFRALYGRRLLQSETDCTEAELLEGVRAGLVGRLQGIESVRGRYRCNGCGNIDQVLFGVHPCLRCQEIHCCYCRSCLSVRKISACTPLYIWKGGAEWTTSPSSLSPSDSLLAWDGQLTVYQERAAQAAIRQIRAKQDMLLYAVTGAGKTEMLFQPIAYALTEGKQVCFASPRTDVILELAPRFKQAFPYTPIGIYFGGSEEKDPHASLILSTTHQLMRFHKRFDVLILDESDAFPYSVDPTLKSSLEQALRPNHTWIYCTATPDPKWLKSFKRTKMELVFVSRRFHGRPLELPKWIWMGRWKDKLARHKVSEKFLRLLRVRLDMERQAFVFVPDVETAERLAQLIKSSAIACEAVYAADALRRQKVEAFRAHRLSVLVTTTILERGVTVPFTDVFVFGSEAQIFDAAALVQICGRAGRHAQDHQAEIYFFHAGITREMRRARKQIADMNRREM